MPTKEDKTFTPKLSKNELIDNLRSNARLQKKFENLNFDTKIDKDFIRKIYYDFSKEESYKKFVYEQEGEENVVELLLELYRLCRRTK